MVLDDRPRPAISSLERAPNDDGMQYRVIHGYRRAFVKVGQGPALLLIHGIGDSSDSWQHVIPTLAKRYTVIAPDLLGHGRSDKPRGDYSIAAYANAMRDLLSVLGIDRVTIVGHSLGGGVAMQFAYQFPHRCERLVLVCTGGVSRDVSRVLRLLATPAAEVILPLLQLQLSRTLTYAVVRLMHRLGTDIGRDADDVVRVIDGLPNETSRAAFVRTLRTVVDGRGQVVTMLDRAYLADGVPLLIVWGDRDAVIPVEHGRVAHEALPGSRLEIIVDAGHFPHRSDPARFVCLLDEFVQSTNPVNFDSERWRVLLRRGRPGAPTGPGPEPDRERDEPPSGATGVAAHPTG